MKASLDDIIKNGIDEDTRDKDLIIHGYKDFSEFVKRFNKVVSTTIAFHKDVYGMLRTIFRAVYIEALKG